MVFRGSTTQTHTTAQPGEIAECRWFALPELAPLGDDAFDLALHLAQGRVGAPPGLRSVVMRDFGKRGSIHSSY